MEKHNLTWRGVDIEITFTPERFGLADHIELRAANKAGLPVTETGYRSWFMPSGTVAQHGDPVAFVTAWLDLAAERTGWRGAQLSLF